MFPCFFGLDKFYLRVFSSLKWRVTKHSFVVPILQHFYDHIFLQNRRVEIERVYFVLIRPEIHKKNSKEISMNIFFHLEEKKLKKIVFCCQLIRECNFDLRVECRPSQATRRTRIRSAKKI